MGLQSQWKAFGHSTGVKYSDLPHATVVHLCQAFAPQLCSGARCEHQELFANVLLKLLTAPKWDYIYST